MMLMLVGSNTTNGAELGGATGAMVPLFFWSRSIKKSRKVSKSKSHSLKVAPVVSTFVRRHSD